MRALTEAEIRESFVNADDDEVSQVALPHDFLLIDWDYLDFFAWQDPASPRRGCVIVERDGAPVGIVLRSTDPSRSRTGMCSICHTMQPGNQVALLSARKAGEEGERGSSVGTYMCTDLSCHDAVRVAAPLAPQEVRRRDHVDRRLDGTRHRMLRFVERVLADR